jgi:CheY-like chemotaxis protein
MKNILIIDDSKSVNYLVESLRDLHYQVTWIKNAMDVLDNIKKCRYDSIILDIMMPIPENWSDEDQIKSDNGLLTGIILFKKIREINAKIPIIIYSAKSSEAVDILSVYIRKPETIENIVDKLKSFSYDK